MLSTAPSFNLHARHLALVLTAGLSTGCSEAPSPVVPHEAPASVTAAASEPTRRDADPSCPGYEPPPPPPPPPAIVRVAAPSGRYSLELPEDWDIRQGKGDVVFIAEGRLHTTPAGCLLREATAPAPESAFHREAIEARLRRSIPDVAIATFGSAPIGNVSVRRATWRGTVHVQFRQGVEYSGNVGGRYLAFECSSDNREKMFMAYENFDAMAASLRFGK